jgi:hypothetical protein
MLYNEYARIIPIREHREVPMALDDKRKGELAYVFLKYTMKERGFELDQSFRRRIGNIAKQTGIPFPEALTFATDLAKEILVEVSDSSRPPTANELEGFDGH